MIFVQPDKSSHKLLLSNRVAGLVMDLKTNLAGVGWGGEGRKVTNTLLLGNVEVFHIPGSVHWYSRV